MNKRYILDVIQPTDEDVKWLDRTLKNITDLLNAGKKEKTCAVLMIVPLEDTDEQPHQNN